VITEEPQSGTEVVQSAMRPLTACPPGSLGSTVRTILTQSVTSVIGPECVLGKQTRKKKLYHQWMFSPS
jgi:hypothetical protein